MAESGGGQVPERSSPQNPARVPGMPDILHIERTVQQVTVQFPFPPPELLAGYKKAGIDPQKLLDLIDAEARRRSDFDRELLRMEDGDRVEKSRTTRRGQTLGFWLCAMLVTAMVIGFLVAPEQAAEVGKLVGPTGIVGLILVFVAGRAIARKQVDAQHENELAKVRGEVERLKRMVLGGPQQ